MTTEARGQGLRPAKDVALFIAETFTERTVEEARAFTEGLIEKRDEVHAAAHAEAIRVARAEGARARATLALDKLRELARIARATADRLEGKEDKAERQIGLDARVRASAYDIALGRVEAAFNTAPAEGQPTATAKAGEAAPGCTLHATFDWTCRGCSAPAAAPTPTGAPALARVCVCARCDEEATEDELCDRCARAGCSSIRDRHSRGVAPAATPAAPQAAGERGP